MTRVNAATAINPLSIAAMVLACCLGSSTASAVTDCMSAPGKDGYYSYRTIDGRKCWFLKVGTTIPTKAELRWTTKRAEPTERPTALGYSPDESIQPRLNEESVKRRAITPPVADTSPAVAPQTSEPAPLRYRMTRVRPAGELPLQPQTSIELMNGSSLSSNVPPHLAPAAPFNERFSGGTD